MARTPENIILDDQELYLWIIRSEKRLENFDELRKRYFTPEGKKDNWGNDNIKDWFDKNFPIDLFCHVQFSEHHYRHHEYKVMSKWGDLHLKKKSLVLDPEEVTSCDQGSV